jgi:hypothetical protein
MDVLKKADYVPFSKQIRIRSTGEPTSEEN